MTEAPPITNVVRARSETEAAWMLAEAREGTRLVAGGTDLMLHIDRGRAKPTALIDIRRAGMDSISIDEGILKIGATTTAAQIWRSDLVRRHARGLWDAAATLSAPTIRNMATLGGNLANASPAADMVPPVLAMGGVVTARRGDDVRRIPAEELAVAPGRTVLSPDELLTGVLLPRWREDAFHHFVKLGFRDAQIIAVCSLALSCELADDGTVRRIGIALGSVAPRVVRAHHVEEHLLGTRLTRAAAAEAVRLLQKDISPIDDVRSTAAHRMKVCQGFLADALARAYAHHRPQDVDDAARRILVEPAPRPPELAAERHDALAAVSASAERGLAIVPTGPLSWSAAPSPKGSRAAKAARAAGRAVGKAANRAKKATKQAAKKAAGKPAPPKARAKKSATTSSKPTARKKR